MNSNQIIHAQWSMESYKVTEVSGIYYKSAISESIFLEISHYKRDNEVALFINLNQRRDLYFKPASLFMYCINNGDTTTVEFDEFSVSMDFAVTLDLLNAEYSNDFFNSEKVIVKIHTSDEVVHAEFNMKGISEIKKRLLSYIEFTDYSWKWDENECIYEIGATMLNFSGMYADKVNVLLIITRGDKEVIYKKQHILDVDFNNGDVGPVNIRIAVPICSISDVYKFDEEYHITLKTPEPKHSELKINWK